MLPSEETWEDKTDEPDSTDPDPGSPARPRNDKYHDLIVNGKRHRIYDTDMLDHAMIWGVAIKRLLEIVNGLMKVLDQKNGSSVSMEATTAG